MGQLLFYWPNCSVAIGWPNRAILFRADLAVIPCQPSGVDLRSAADAVKLVKQALSVRNGPPEALVFLSRAVKGTKLKDEAIPSARRRLQQQNSE